MNLEAPRVLTDHYVSFDGMTWPRANESVADLEWQMRYGNPTAVRFLVASVIGAYLELTRCPREKRDRVVRRLREAEARSLQSLVEVGE